MIALVYRHVDFQARHLTKYEHVSELEMETNMRKVIISMIVVVSIIALGLCGILVYGLNGNNIFAGGSRTLSETHLVLEKEVSLEGIDSISVLYDMNSNDIFLYESDDDKLLVKEYSGFELAENEISTVEVNGNSLEVKGKKRNVRVMSFGNIDNYTQLWIPSSYSGSIKLETSSGEIISQFEPKLKKEFAASSTSGDIKIPSVSADKSDIASISGLIQIDTINANSNINIGTSSGDIRLQQIAGEVNIASISGEIKAAVISGNAQLSTTSGDIAIQRIDGDTETSTTSGEVKILEGKGSREISSSSGDITIQGADGSFNLSTISGEILFQAQAGMGEIETSSGDIRIELSELTGSINLDSISGDVNIKLPESSSFDFEANTTSGDINTFFDDNLSFSKRGNNAVGAYGAEADGKKVDIETTSGDIRVQKMQ